jgi:hypothetical protein
VLEGYGEDEEDLQLLAGIRFRGMAQAPDQDAQHVSHDPGCAQLGGHERHLFGHRRAGGRLFVNIFNFFLYI